MTPVLWVILGAAVVALLSGGVAIFTGFRSQKPGCYAETVPYFALQDVLKGDLVCDGVIYGPRGHVISRFNADITMHWDGNRGRMVERFRYASGAVQDREWWLEVDEDGAIRADADDLVDVGRGRQSGATVEMRYRIRLPDEGGGHVLSVRDWMYLTPDGVVVNRSQFRKFGFKVAELVATIRRTEAT
ncbi:DUF3833 domain-containing protein [Roseovarius sp. SCSIO 43702]|uniref:DUF3833 family protein n=1 Tax=Roseovarius sp. SCSIO 43702 TaxID=2823043 RepID=UPI001C7307A2|nr:DUF3833 family protein [Roseovarius sp. SCSIO 43702]QYX57235.1 DUF3833 domain-containing protein [Roseovarius sp. SCSIO 43702]